MTIHRYDDESAPMRKVRMAQVHGEQNNKYRIAGLSAMAEVGRYALEQTKFEKSARRRVDGTSPWSGEPKHRTEMARSSYGSRRACDEVCSRKAGAVGQCPRPGTHCATITSREEAQTSNFVYPRSTVASRLITFVPQPASSQSSCSRRLRIELAKRDPNRFQAVSLRLARRPITMARSAGASARARAPLSCRLRRCSARRTDPPPCAAATSPPHTAWLPPPPCAPRQSPRVPACR